MELTLRPHRTRAPLVPLVDDPLQLFDWFRIVVDLQLQYGVVVQPHAAVLLHDDERRRLLTARIAAAGLSPLERRDEALRQVAGRLLERVDHVRDDRFARKNVALSGAELP